VKSADVLAELTQVAQLVAIEAVRAVDAALEPGDVERAGVQIHLRPAHANGLAGTQAMAIDDAEQHAVAERIASALAGRLDQPARFVGPEIAAIGYFRLFARRGGYRHEVGLL